MKAAHTGIDHQRAVACRCALCLPVRFSPPESRREFILKVAAQMGVAANVGAPVDESEAQFAKRMGKVARGRRRQRWNWDHDGATT